LAIFLQNPPTESYDSCLKQFVLGLLFFVELCEYIICNYPGEPHVVAAIWPCTYLFTYSSPSSGGSHGFYVPEKNTY